MVSEEAYEPQFGARPLKRFVQRQIETPLARMIKENMPEGTKVNGSNDSQELTFDVQNLQLNREKALKAKLSMPFLIIKLVKSVILLQTRNTIPFRRLYSLYERNH